MSASSGIASSQTRAPRAGDRGSPWALVLALLGACGGTNGLEAVLGADDAGGTDPDAGADATFETGTPVGAGDASDAGSDARGGSSDATIVGPTADRSTPDRPDAVTFVPPDTGAPAMSAEAGDAPAGCTDFTHVTTYTILAAQGPDCLKLLPDGGGDPNSCPIVNGCTDFEQLGGTCETQQPGNTGPVTWPPSVCPVWDVGAHYDPTATEAYRQMCLNTLSCIFSSGCAGSLQETPCLCGATDTSECLAGTSPPTGPCYNDYHIDLGRPPAAVGTDSKTIQSNFLVQTYGSGQANALVQCIASFGCLGCFGVHDAGAH